MTTSPVQPTLPESETTNNPFRMSVRRLRAKLSVRFHHFHLVAYRLPVTGDIIDAELAGKLPKKFRAACEQVPGKLIATIATRKALSPAEDPLGLDDGVRLAAAIVSTEEPTTSRALGRKIALGRLLKGCSAIEASLFTDSEVKPPKCFMTMTGAELGDRIRDRSLLREFGLHAKLFPAKSHEEAVLLVEEVPDAAPTAEEVPTGAVVYVDSGNLAGL